MFKVSQLPAPTNATKKGPSIWYENSVLCLKYDFEDEKGDLELVKIVFAEVLAHKFHQSVCADFGFNFESGKIGQYKKSNWLTEVLDRWKKSVGWQSYQLELGGEDRFSHYVISFDDVGVIEVISSNSVSEKCVS